jgi:hypothetical protein
VDDDDANVVLLVSSNGRSPGKKMDPVVVVVGPLLPLPDEPTGGGTGDTPDADDTDDADPTVCNSPSASDPLPYPSSFNHSPAVPPVVIVAAAGRDRRLSSFACRLDDVVRREAPIAAVIYGRGAVKPLSLLPLFVIVCGVGFLSNLKVIYVFKKCAV